MKLPNIHLPCATCGAEPGAMCVGLENGKPQSQSHVGRRRMAIREYLEERTK